MIKIEITADTAEEARNQLITLLGTNTTTTLWVKENPETALAEIKDEKIQEKAPAPARTRAKVEKTPPETDPPSLIENSSLPAQTPVPVTSGTFTDPISAKVTITQSNDLLDSPAPLNGADLSLPSPTSNRQASLLDTPATETKKPGEIITLNDVRNKIAKAVIAGTITKPGVTAFLANYETAKGQPCTIPSDIQEKDMALVYNAIDFM